MEFHEFLHIAKTDGFGSVSEDSHGGENLDVAVGRFTYKSSSKLFHRGRMLVGREEATSSGRLWASNYVGKIDSAFRPTPKLRLHEIYAFADESRKKMRVDSPFRGPGSYKRGKLEYQSTCEGDIDHFESNETVFFKGKRVMHLNIQGGFSLPLK